MINKIIVLAVLLSLLLCSCRTTDCSLQAVSGGTGYCEQEIQ